MHLEGSCRCGAVTFSCDSHAPVPYQLCYCTICCKTAGGGGYAINLSAVSSTLKVEGARSPGRLSRRDHRRYRPLRNQHGRAQLLHALRGGAVALRSRVAGAAAPVRLGDRQRPAGGAGADPPHARRQAGLGATAGSARRQAVSAISRREHRGMASQARALGGLIGVIPGRRSRTRTRCSSELPE